MQVFQVGKKAALKLILGDTTVLLVSLLLSLILRNLDVPARHTILINIYAFIPVFALWILGFFIYNLYGRSTVSTSKNLPGSIFQATLLNALIAIIYFYIVSIPGVTPKTTLIIISVFSFLLMVLWRVIIWPKLSRRPNETVVIIGRNAELLELYKELNENHSLHVSAVIYDSRDSGALKAELKRLKSKVIIVDMTNPEAEDLFTSFAPDEILRLRFINPAWLYEELFGRIPLSNVTNAWLFAHVTYEQKLYDSAKRIMDVILAVIMGVLSLVFYPFVALAIKLEDGGKIFIHQDRIGRGGRVIRITKFRSMTGDDKGSDFFKSQLRVTKVGKFIRMTRIDELPQLWNVLKGEESLVGPRPELIPLVEKYSQDIPFYPVRHVIAPGLTGWAQLHQINSATDPHHATAVEATREKLSYDLYYLKHRSLLLDIVVLLRTIQIIFSRQGS